MLASPARIIVRKKVAQYSPSVKPVTWEILKRNVTDILVQSIKDTDTKKGGSGNV